MGDMPPWGTPPEEVRAEGPLLLRTGRLVVKERGGFVGDTSYDLVAEDGELLGRVLRETGVAGARFGPSWVLVDPKGEFVGQISRSDARDRRRYVVSGPGGREAGTVTRMNSFGPPRLAVRAVDGFSARFVGDGSREVGERVLVRSDGTEVGRVSWSVSGLGSVLNGNDTYRVRLRREVTGAGRLCALASVICADLILNDRRRRRRR